jgi:hypothetical protein
MYDATDMLIAHIAGYIIGVLVEKYAQSKKARGGE